MSLVCDADCTCRAAVVVSIGMQEYQRKIMYKSGQTIHGGHPLAVQNSQLIWKRIVCSYMYVHI